MGLLASKTPSTQALAEVQQPSSHVRVKPIEQSGVSTKGGYVKYCGMQYVTCLLQDLSCPLDPIFLPVLIGSRADPGVVVPTRTDWDLIITPQLLLIWLEKNAHSLSSVVAVRKQATSTADSDEAASAQSVYEENKNNFISGLSVSVSCQLGTSRMDFEALDSMKSSGALLITALADTKECREGEFPGDGRCVIAPLSVLILIKQTHILFAKNWFRHVSTLQLLLKQHQKITRKEMAYLPMPWDPLSPFAPIADLRFHECCQIYGEPPPLCAMLSLPRIYKVQPRVVESLGLPLLLSEKEFGSWPLDQQLDFLRSIMRRWVVHDSPLGRLEGLCTKAPCRWLAVFIINHYDELSKSISIRRPFPFDVDRAVLAVESTSPLQVLPADVGFIFSQRRELPLEINLLLMHFLGRVDLLKPVSRRFQTLLSNPEVLRRAFLFRWPSVPLHALQQHADKTIDWGCSFDLCARLEVCFARPLSTLPSLLEATVLARAAMSQRRVWLQASSTMDADFVALLDEFCKTCLILSVDLQTARNPATLTVVLSGRFSGVLGKHRVVLKSGEMEDSRGHVWHENLFSFQDPKLLQRWDIPRNTRSMLETVMFAIAEQNNVKTSL